MVCDQRSTAMHGHAKQGSLSQYCAFSTLPVRAPCREMEGSFASAIASVIDLLWTACLTNVLKSDSMRDNVYTS